METDPPVQYTASTQNHLPSSLISNVPDLTPSSLLIIFPVCVCMPFDSCIRLLDSVRSFVLPSVLLVIVDICHDGLFGGTGLIHNMECL